MAFSPTLKRTFLGVGWTAEAAWPCFDLVAGCCCPFAISGMTEGGGGGG